MIVQADARSLPLRDGCVQTCITSPPYFGLRDYGTAGQIGLEPTPDAYVAQLVAVFREVRRVLRDDGTVWLNLGDSYCGGNSGNQSNVGQRYGKESQGHVFRRDGKYAASIQLKPKDLIGIPWRVAFAMQADGWYLRQDIIWHKPNPMPESVRDRCTKAHEYVFLLSKRERYYWDAEAMVETGTVSKGTYAAVKGKSTRARSLGKDPTGNEREGVGWLYTGNRNRRSVWTVTTEPYPGAHYAVMPTALVEPMVLAGAPLGGLVLDPFCGTGTVLEVAQRLGRVGVGCDISYHDQSRVRTAQRGLRWEVTA